MQPQILNTEDQEKEVLTESPIMEHLLSALEEGTNIGDYGRLTFVLTARHFMSAETMQSLLERQPGIGTTEAKAIIQEIELHDYSPPTVEQIQDWQNYQDFEICPSVEDDCDLVEQLHFPQYIYDRLKETN